jgi:hypothetical protein
MKDIVIRVVSFRLDPGQQITIRAKSKAANGHTLGWPTEGLHHQRDTGPTNSIPRLEAPYGYAVITTTRRKILTVGAKGH